MTMLAHGQMWSMLLLLIAAFVPLPGAASGSLPRYASQSPQHSPMYTPQPRTGPAYMPTLIRGSNGPVGPEKGPWRKPIVVKSVEPTAGSSQELKISDPEPVAVDEKSMEAGTSVPAENSPEPENVKIEGFNSAEGFSDVEPLFDYVAWAERQAGTPTAPHPTDKNVLGDSLETCSKPGMAGTGKERNGFCESWGEPGALEPGHTGSASICVRMTELFWSVIRNSEHAHAGVGKTLHNKAWSRLPCHGYPSSDCPLINWCVSQWAFGSYIASSPEGCDAVQVICDATNMKALEMLKAKAGPDFLLESKGALACLEAKCQPTVQTSLLDNAAVTGIQGLPTGSLPTLLVVATSGVMILLLMAVMQSRPRRAIAIPISPDYEQFLD
eukprot:gnl/TRDRNA2_/TRDRNA2_192275_c0_seq1.p1 gnl/TRDRNA2_/TRDRNA2_192275_c0~~gnl/TRDRNA2_/TRDRNA2_192275_c0_seq1.p1  ORF type:complete len:384 (+),score=44.67 gnl/TRDRNA2_/TRDRNA2_192275_c0_seq1:62-1213(+)